MSWIDKIKTELIITCGDGKQYKPQWINAVKTKDYNVAEFEFPEVSGLPDGHLVFINANMTKSPDVTPVSSFFQTDGVIGLYENIGSGLIWSISFTYKKS